MGQFGPLVRWLKVNFSECFMAWIHVKALRVFVESVLRYGLPVNFQGMVLLPQKKNPEEATRHTQPNLCPFRFSWRKWRSGNACWTRFWPIGILSTCLLQN